MQRRRDADALGLSRNRAAEEIHLSALLVKNIVQHGRRVVSLRANLVHFPGVFVELHAERGGDEFALFNQCVEQMAEASGCSANARESCSGRTDSP